MKKVYGSYLSSIEARSAVDKLLEQGYTRDEIKVVSNKDLGGELQHNENNVDTDHRSLWEKIKDAFTFDEYNDDYWDKDLDKNEKLVLEGYKTNLQAGEIVVMIEEGSKAYRDHFRDGVPDWDERENEFNEDFADENIRADKDTFTGVKPPLSNEFSNETHLNASDLNKENINDDEDLLDLQKQKFNADKDVFGGDAGIKDNSKHEIDPRGNSEKGKDIFKEENMNQDNLKVDTSRIDESSIKNKDQDPLKDEKFHDNSMVTDELIDLDKDDKKL
nr:general stress protein [Tissierella sp.]